MSMPGPLISVYVLGAILAITALAIGVYDLWALIVWGDEFTISWQVWVLSKGHPVLPLVTGLVTGLLMGHLFWRVAK